MGWCRCLRVLSATSGCSVTPLPAGISSCPGWTSAAAAGWRCRRSRPRTGPAGSSSGAGSSAPFGGGPAPFGGGGPALLSVLVHGSLFYYFLFFVPSTPRFLFSGVFHNTFHARCPLGAGLFALSSSLLRSPLPRAARPKPLGGRGQGPDPAAALTPRGGEKPQKGGRNGAAVPSEPAPALFCWVLGRNRRFLGREQPPAAIAAFYFPLLGCGGVGGGGRRLKNNQQNPLFFVK